MQELKRLGVFIGVLLFYLPALWNYYIIDDFQNFIRSGEKPKSKWQAFLWQFRGLKYWGEKNFWSHSIPIIFHAIVCALIYFAFGRSEGAYLAALYFAANPVSSEVSVWLSGRYYAVGAM